MAKLRHCGILVHDLEISVKLYTNVFGFKEIKRGVIMGKFAEELFNLSNMHLTYVKLKSKGCGALLELWKIKDLLPEESNRTSHIAITVQDINRVYEQLKERKLHFFSKPIKARDSQVKLFFCKDYDGNVLEIVQDPRLKS